MNERRTPPGWPPGVPPPGSPGWQDAAVAWLLDQCPADYRAYGAWRRHPVALAWIAARHVEGQVVVMRDAYRQVRVELGEHVEPRALPEILGALEREGLRLRANAHAAALVRDALQGVPYTPRL
ncbi:hypothetical protein [Agilicoccus flavus]|uniref:hypothetical protein n=1 Tax=Agilicoccus flavus TaxID=2775968 RepID=UPI001CF63012|nr:hypothetical protein [Agilicoccus flavus]